MFYTFISMITKESVSLYTFFSSESRRLVRVFYQINFVPVDFQWISEINLQSSWSSNYWFISVLEVVVISRSSDSQYSWTFGLQGNIYERECVVSRCSRECRTNVQNTSSTLIASIYTCIYLSDYNVLKYEKRNHLNFINKHD